MKKIQHLALVLALVILTAACGTKSTYIPTPGAQTLNQADGFKVGQVSDLSGFQFKAGDSDAFDLKDAMTSALRAAIAGQGLTGDGYSVDVNILAYEPGSAFARWLMPGAGATKLTVEASIADKSGAQVAKIPVERHISAGGGFTIGADKYIFEDVAKAIVTVIKNPAKAPAPVGQ
jgi:hypothetical protein